MPTKAGEEGAVIIRAGSRYITFGSVPAADSLEVLRIEKVPREWLPQGESMETGDTFTLPLHQSPGQAHLAPVVIEEQHIPGEAREVWASYEVDDRNNYQSLRKVCSEHDLGISAQPSTEEMLDALMDAGVVPPAPSSANNLDEVVTVETSTQEVSYTPLELYQGIEEAEGPAAEQALEMLEGQVGQYLKKREVVEDYLAINDPDSQFDEVRDVADEHDVHWRTVHRYADDLLDEQDRLLKPQPQQ